MSEAAILLKRFTFEHGGKTLELGRPNLGTEAAYGRHMLREEAKFIESQRASLGAQGYQDALRLHMANGTNNWFGWCRPGFLESLASPVNAAHFFWLWFSQKSTTGPKESFADEKVVQALYRDVTPQFEIVKNEKGEDVKESRPSAYEKLNALLNEAVNDPNPLPLD